MKAKGRIAVIIPAVRDAYAGNILQGIHETASQLGYDVLVFTSSSNRLPDYPPSRYILGAEKIYEIGINSNVDGIILAGSLFFKTPLLDNILEMIRKSGKPCVTLSYPNNLFENVQAEENHNIEEITDHLINVHNYRRIYCLTGIKGFTDADERLEYFLNSVRKNGLDESECLTFYGDFWTESAKELAEKIHSGQIPKPEAVVCANDIMAVTLCKSLKNYGFRIPEDIAVTGFDGSIEASLNSPSVTTVAYSEKIMGSKGVIRLFELINGYMPLTETGKAEIIYRTSCGCSNSSSEIDRNEYISRQLDFNRIFSEYYLASDFIIRLSDTSDINDFVQTVDSLSFLFPKWNQLAICVNENWMGDFENPEKNADNDYSDTMQLLMYRDRNSSSYTSRHFSISKLIPSFSDEPEPKFMVFLPLHYEEKALGYCVTEYEQGINFIMEERCKSWCDAVSNGLHILRDKLYTEYIKRKVEAFSTRDISTGLLSKKGLIQEAASFADTQNRFLMLVSWRKIDVSAIDSVADNYIIHIANAVQMSCDSSEICARINMNTFAFLTVLPYDEEPQKFTDNKQLRILRMLSSIRSQIKNLPIPDFESYFVKVGTETDFEKIIKEAESELDKKISSAKKEISDYSAALSGLRLEMRINPQFDWSMNRIAEEYGISKSYFMRLYKKQFGTTFNDDWINWKIEKAKNLLKSSNTPLKKIAFECGYDEISHFMRQFKDKTGMTAMQYRNTYNQKNK